MRIGREWVTLGPEKWGPDLRYEAGQTSTESMKQSPFGNRVPDYKMSVYKPKDFHSRLLSGGELP